MAYNKAPTKQEISNIIIREKNHKSTPDIKNEMLKRPGETMVEFLYPLITTIWTGNATSHMEKKETSRAFGKEKETERT